MTKIIRVVKMTFQEDKVERFLAQFNENKDKIRAFEGCTHLELWRDIQQNHRFYTYSHWDSEDHLNTYRESELFKGIWANTKILFAQKAEAFSVSRQIKL